MIELYSGTPGSGKSLRAAYKIWDLLKRGKPIICNFDIDTKPISKNGKKKIGKFLYMTNQEITPKWLIEYAQANHVYGREHQTTLIIDECGIMFSCRDWDAKGRQAWNEFFMQHRKLGYDVILICQMDRMLDRWIRAFIETEWKHRAIKNYQFLGLILSLITGGLFIAIEYWYGAKLKCGSEMFLFSKKKSKIYNTYAMFAK